MYIKENYVAVPVGRYEDLVELETRVIILVDAIIDGLYEEDKYLRILGKDEAAELYLENKKRKSAELAEWIQKREEEKKNAVDR